MNIYELRQLIGQEIVDYNLLKQALSDYAHPRKKISTWLSSGELIRVKKGLYVFGEKVSRKPYQIEVLANLIYGPSAISLNYALYYYGLIPERVQTITSITNKRFKDFSTPVGDFTYQYLSRDKYAIGIQLLADKGSSFLIATPEKALCDLIVLDIKNIEMKSIENLQQFLFADLRCEESEIKKLDSKLLSEIKQIYRNQRLNQFIKYYLAWIK